MKNVGRVSLWGCFLLLLIWPDAWAAPQGSGFMFQGQIKQNGIPANGACDFQFGLWNDALANAPANQLGVTQAVNNVSLNNGLVSVELNAAGQFGASAFNGDARWLGISLRCPAGGGSYTALTPRTKISSAPYALMALNAPSASGVWSLSGSNAYYTGGNVGIGTNSPQGPLDVRAGDNSFFRMDSNYGDLHFNGGNDGTFGLFNEGASGRTSIVANNLERFTVLNSGFVGVGTSTPGMSLEVTAPSYYGRPAIGASDGSAYAYLHVTGTSDHSLIWDNQRALRFGTESGRGSGYGELMRINANGTVGIGTQAPGAKVEAYAQAGAGNGTVAIKGTTEPSFDLFGNFFQGGVGVWGDAPSNIGVLGTSTESNGVKGESQDHDGVFGVTHNVNRGGVVGVNDAAGFGVSGFSPNGGFAGVFGNGSKNGVFGSTASSSDSGVHGRNDSGGWGINGYSAGTLVGQGRFGGTGVEGISDGLGGYGVIGRAHGLNGVGVHAESQNEGATALWAYNPAGRGALIDGYTEMNGYLDVRGAAYVNVLTIKGGADLAEPFDIVDGLNNVAREPEASTNSFRAENEFDKGGMLNPTPGMVVVIDPDHPGKLAISSKPYDHTVAGIISGANDLSPGMVMQAEHEPLARGAHPVALTGRVWCWCDTTSTAIAPGDMLTTSSRPGFAMKADNRELAFGAVVGKAMTSLAKGETGLVLVLVSLQ